MFLLGFLFRLFETHISQHYCSIVENIYFLLPLRDWFFFAIALHNDGAITPICFTDFLVHSPCDINNKYILLPQYRFIVIDLIRTNLIVYQKFKKNKQSSDTSSDNLRGVILALTGNLIIAYKSMSCFSTPCALPKLSD